MVDSDNIFGSYIKRGDVNKAIEGVGSGHIGFVDAECNPYIGTGCAGYDNVSFAISLAHGAADESILITHAR